MLRQGLAMFALVWLVAACNLNQGNRAKLAEGTATPAGTWIRVEAPNAGDLLELGAYVALSAVVENANADIERVEMSIDGEIIRRYLMPNADDAPRITLQERWQADRLGEHKLKISVCTVDGSCVESAPVGFDVIAAATEAVPTAGDSAETRKTESLTPAFTTATPLPARSTAQDVVTAKILTNVLNVRTGPAIQFEPVSTLQKDETVRVFARTESEWYKIFLAGQERWIYGAAGSGLVELTGPYPDLPIDHGPPLPTQPPATATPVPPQYPNLVIEGAEIEGGALVCGEPGVLRFRVRNSGNAPTQWGGSIRVRDVQVRNQAGQEFQAPNFGLLAAEGHTPWFRVNLLVDTYYGEKHLIEITVDSQKQITESNELDNRWEYAYVLQQGSCP